MLAKRSIALAVGAALMLGITVPKVAHASGIPFYITSTGGGVMAIIGAVMLGNEDPDKKKTGKTLLIAGLAISVGCSTSGLLIDLLVYGPIGSLGTLDRVDRLEAEITAGGGPMIDAYSAGLGIPHDEVMAQVRASIAAVPVQDEADAVRFGADLRNRLLPEARLTEESAGLVAAALNEERSHLGDGNTPWHDTLAYLSGVPVAELAPSIAAPLDARIAAAEQPGTVISARTALHEDALNTMDAVVERIVTDHGARLDARMAELSGRAAAGASQTH